MENGKEGKLIRKRGSKLLCNIFLVGSKMLVNRKIVNFQTLFLIEKYFTLIFEIVWYSF